MQPSVVAVISEETQNDVVAALHAAGVGHLTRVIRRERGAIAAQLRRAGIETDELPVAIDTADRTVLVSPAPNSLETACLVLQRGATCAWTLTTDDGWQAIDDKAIEIAAARGLPARPVAPAHRSGRTFRKGSIHRCPRRDVFTPPASAGSEDATSS